MNEEFLTLNEFAKKIRCHKKYVLEMIKDGKILAFRLTDAPHSHWRIKSSEVDRLISYELNKKNKNAH